MRTMWALVIALTVTLTAADGSFYGTWTFVPSKSSVPAPDLTLASIGHDEWRQTDQDGRSFTFKIDGKQYPDAYGGTVSAKRVDDTTWEITNYVNGKPGSVDTMKLSTDGKTLTVTSKTISGTPVGDQKITWHRTASGTGFAGTWKGEAINLPPFTLEIVPSGQDGLTFRIGDLIVVEAKFDGKPYPMSGSQMPKGSTASFTRQSASAFQSVQHFPDGTTALTASVSVSGDGNTLTDSGQAGRIKRVWVFERKK